MRTIALLVWTIAAAVWLGSSSLVTIALALAATVGIGYHAAVRQ